MPYLRSDTAAIHVGITNLTLPPGKWQTLTGGDVQADTLNAAPAGMTQSYSFGGVAKRSTVTVTRLLGANGVNDSLWNYIVPLEGAVSRRMSVGYTPLDQDGNPNGNTITMTGTLNSVQTPTWDANATNPAVLTLIMDCDLDAAIGSSFKGVFQPSPGTLAPGPVQDPF